MVAKKSKAKKAVRKIKNLPAKGKNVKGGMNFGNIKGDTTQEGHEKWIELNSWSH